MVVSSAHLLPPKDIVKDVQGTLVVDHGLVLLNGMLETIIQLATRMPSPDSESSRARYVGLAHRRAPSVCAFLSRFWVLFTRPCRNIHLTKEASSAWPNGSAKTPLPRVERSSGPRMQTNRPHSPPDPAPRSNGLASRVANTGHGQTVAISRKSRACGKRP